MPCCRRPAPHCAGSTAATGVLVLTDLYGASPSNLAARLARLGTPVRRVSALNLPMLLRVMNYPELGTRRTARRRRRRCTQRRDPDD